MARSVSQIQTDGQLRLFENLLSPHCRSVILFHKPVSFPLRLERVNRWERIASRRRPAFSSHLISSIKVEVKKKHSCIGRNFSCFAAHWMEQDLFWPPALGARLLDSIVHRLEFSLPAV